MIVLLGVLVVVVGFAAKRNPLLAVAVSGIVTGLLGGMSPQGILAEFGKGFAGSLSVTTFVITLPVIGLLERYGLQEQGRRLITRLTGLTTGRLIAAYLVIRQLTAAVGLLSIGGPAQTVRPLIAPMAEGAAERRYGALPEAVRERIRSFATSADNVGAFFGEDIFLAVGSVLLTTSFVDTTYHVQLVPLDLAVWAIPSAICALLVHGFRLLRLDRSLELELGPAAVSGAPSGPADADAAVTVPAPTGGGTAAAAMNATSTSKESAE
jgi:uncharacterized membrane protein